MALAAHIPQAPLSRYISNLWYVDEQLNYVKEKILPTSSIALMFNFGSPFRIFDTSDDANSHIKRHSWVAGFHTQHIYHQATAVRTHMIGVSFKPGGAYPFFECPISELSNQIVELDHVWGRFVDEAHERLLDAPTLPLKFSVLEGMLLRRLKRDIRGLNVIEHAVQQIEARHRSNRIQEVTNRLGMSQKHLIGQFKKMVGVSPKTLHRVVRFQQVLHGIVSAEPENLGLLAAHCGYYDQAHFNRDFFAFCGMSPTRYFELRRQFLSDHQLTEGAHFVPVG